jgi:hypothetical protein
VSCLRRGTAAAESRHDRGSTGPIVNPARTGADGGALFQDRAAGPACPPKETSRRRRPASVVLKRAGNVSTAAPLVSASIQLRQEDGPAYRPPGVLRLSKNPAPGANSPQPGDVFSVPARDFVVRTAILVSRPVFWLPGRPICLADRFLASRRLFFRSRPLIQRSRVSIFLPGRLSFFPGRHLRDPGRRVSIESVILLSELPSLSQRAHPRPEMRSAREAHPTSFSRRCPPSLAHDKISGLLSPAESLGCGTLQRLCLRKLTGKSHKPLDRDRGPGLGCSPSSRCIPKAVIDRKEVSMT